jgi:serine/threonine-protein kinase
VVGDFVVERELGRGGMGVVYAARHRTIGRPAAIKVIGEDMSRDADAVARFLREARAVARLRSPHVVDVFGFGTLDDGRAYCVMELLQGESLRERIARGRVPLDEAIDVLAQVCRGLEVVHAAGIVHRDLKPENLFIERRPGAAPTLKILDFGLVKAAEVDVAQTQTGVGFGTPLYAAPEQLRSARDVDERADIYSLGCVAYELVVGRVPFPRESVAELIAAHLGEQPRPPCELAPRIPPALDALVVAMLAKDPRRRPRIGHVQDILDGLRTPQLSRPASIGSLEIPRTRRTARWRTSAALVAAAIVIMALALWFHAASSEHPQRIGSGDAPAKAARDREKTTATGPMEPSTHSAPDALPVDAAPGERATAPRRRVVPQPTKPAPIAPSQPAQASGVLAISSKPPCDIWVDGRRTGQRTPVRALDLPAGSHHVTLVNETYAISDTFDEEVTPGALRRVTKDYSSRLPADPNSTVDPFGGQR